MKASDADVARALVKALSPKWTKYIKGRPHPKQLLAMCLDHVREVFFGGAAGPGKSWWLLASSLQYADQKEYHALLVRRNYLELSQAGGLMDVSHDWLDGTDASWNENLKRWAFPSGATLQFGHMDNPQDIRRYKGGEYQFIGIDELTDFNEREAMFFHSRLRRKKGSEVPLRWRAASNPGGVGHGWVKDRYISGNKKDVVFIPATLEDNPHIDAESYVGSLANLDPITRERLRKGDWDVAEGGHIFDRSWFATFLDVAPEVIIGRVRAWDLAATVGPDSKETSGTLISRTPKGIWVIEDVVHGKWLPGARDGVILQKSIIDGDWVKIIIEEEPGSGGKYQSDALIKMLCGRRVEAVKASGDKFVRAAALASQAQAGNVALVRGPWNRDFIEQLHQADPNSPKLLMDMMDSTSLGFNSLLGKGIGQGAVETPDVQKALRESDSEEAEDLADTIRKSRIDIYKFEDQGGWDGLMDDLDLNDRRVERGIFN